MRVPLRFVRDPAVEAERRHDLGDQFSVLRDQPLGRATEFHFLLVLLTLCRPCAAANCLGLRLPSIFGFRDFRTRNFRLRPGRT